jgi:hypothetical protein
MNKGELRTHFKQLLNRSDCTDALADTFISQSITRMERVLRIPPMEKTLTYTITSNTTELTIPTDFLEITGIYHGTTNMIRVSLAKFIELTQGGETGTPKYFCRQADKLTIYPYPTSGTVTMNYYASFPVLVSDSDTNDLTLIASDMIAYGALTYAADYFLDERGPQFEGKFQQGLTEIQMQANDAETSGTVQVMQPHSTYQDF